MTTLRSSPIQSPTTLIRLAWLVGLILAVVACGGGGGSSPTPPPPMDPPPPISPPPPMDPPPPSDPPPVVTPPVTPPPIVTPPPVVTPPVVPPPVAPPPVVTPPTDPPPPADPPPPVDPPPPPREPTTTPPGASLQAPSTFDCTADATAIDGTVYAVNARNTACVQYLQKAVHDALDADLIPQDSQGRTILVDIFWDISANPEVRASVRDHTYLANTNGVPYSTDGTWPLPIGTDTTGSKNLAEWRNTIADGLEPQAWVGPRFRYSGSNLDYDGFAFRASDVAAAWVAAMTDNALYFDTLQAQNRIAVINYSHLLGAQFAWQLQDERTNAEARGWQVGDHNFDFLLVAPTGNGLRGTLDAAEVGIPGVDPSHLSSASLAFLQSSPRDAIAVHLPNNRLDGPQGALVIDKEVDDYLSGLTTAILEQLAALDEPQRVDPSSCATVFECRGLRKTGVFNFDPVLPGISAELRQKLSDLHEQTIRSGTETTDYISLLKHLAKVALLAKSNDLLFVSHLNADGDGPAFVQGCSVARESCLYIEFSHADGEAGTGEAAARLSPIVDSLWLLWPTLTKPQLLSVLFGCTEDRGDAGVDNVYGQGVLKLDSTTNRCVFSPTGTLVDPTSSSTASGYLRVAGTAETAYRALDQAGRDFSYTAVSTDLKQDFSPMDAIAIPLHDGERVRWSVGASNDHWALWASSAIASNLWLQYGMAFEPDGLMGARGTEAFILEDGRSAFATLTWAKPLSDAVWLTAYVRVAQGAAYGNGHGVIRRLDLRQEKAGASINIEPDRFQNSDHAMGLYLEASCDSGTSGYLEVVSMETAISGTARCDASLSARMRF